MPAYRILTLDGGGVCGLFTAVLLERLESTLPGVIARADLLAGTSIGGILALALAHGHKPADLVAQYRAHAPKIFESPWQRQVHDLGGLIGAKYGNEDLKRLLEQLYGTESTLADLRQRVLVPAFRLDNLRRPPRPGEIRRWKPKFFHNYPGRGSDGHERLVDVAMRTSAAPTFFPSYQGYIDGGVVDNSPALCALAQALDSATGKQSLDDLSIISIGSGLHPIFVEGDKLDWGEVQWSKPIVPLMVDGVLGVADFQCSRILGDRFFRLGPILPEVVRPDDASKLDRLEECARAVDLSEAVAWLKAYFLDQHAQ